VLLEGLPCTHPCADSSPVFPRPQPWLPSLPEGSSGLGTGPSEAKTEDSGGQREKQGWGITPSAQQWGCQGDDSLAVPGTCGTEHNVLGHRLWGWGHREAAGAMLCIPSLPCFPG